MNFLDKSSFVETNKGALSDKYKIMKEVKKVSYSDRKRDFWDCLHGMRESMHEEPQGGQESIEEKHIQA